MTKRQQQLLDFMVDHQIKKGLPPTLREMMEHMGIGSTNGIVCHLVALEKAGYVVNSSPGRSHSWRPVKRTLDITCPHCGGEIEVAEGLE